MNQYDSTGTFSWIFPKSKMNLNGMLFGFFWEKKIKFQNYLHKRKRSLKRKNASSTLWQTITFQNTRTRDFFLLKNPHTMSCKNITCPNSIRSHWLKASGGIFPAAFRSENTAADLSKSQPFCSRHRADHSRFMPDLAAKAVARLCLEAKSSSTATGSGPAVGAEALLTTAARVQSAETKAFLVLMAVAAQT